MEPLEVLIAAAGLTPQIADSVRSACAGRATRDAATGVLVMDPALFRGVLEETLDTLPGARGVYEANREQRNYWREQQARLDRTRAQIAAQLGKVEK